MTNQDWRERFDKEFESKPVYGGISGETQAVSWTNEHVTLEAIKAFIESEIEKAEERAKRERTEEANSSY